MAQINELDLAFIVDTTGSMGGLIQAAQKQMVDMVDALATAVDVDMRLGIVEYRDHPPQDSMVYRAYDLTEKLDKAKKTINNLKADGGGDAPEAVFAGIVAACEKLSWRPHARRMAVLVGDAPPHGVGGPGDAFPRGCPSGETLESVSAKAEQTQVTLYALGLTRQCAESFERISRMTGGRLFRADQAEDAMRQMKEILQNEFGQLDFDREVHRVWGSLSDPTVELVAKQIEATPPKVASAVCRLQSRGFMLPERTRVSA
jgi:Mg-chelatase subunit ChlD